MISMPIVSMIITIIIITVLIIVTYIILNIDEKEIKKQEELESLMIELKIPKRDRIKIWHNKKKYGILKIQYNKNFVWDLYIKQVLKCKIIDSYLDKDNLTTTDNYDELIDLLLDRTHNANYILLKSYRHLLWLIEDTKIKEKDKELIYNKITTNIRSIFKLFEILKSNNHNKIKIKITKNEICNLNLDNYPLLIDSILQQIG